MDLLLRVQSAVLFWKLSVIQIGGSDFGRILIITVYIAQWFKNGKLVICTNVCLLVWTLDCCELYAIYNFPMY